MKEDIEKWLASPSRSYAEGVQLLASLTDNTHMVRVFAGRSPRFAMDDLIAEVKRLARKTGGMDGSPKAAQVSAAVADAAVVEQASKQLVHELWVELSRLKEDLFNEGEGNDADSCKRRAAMLEELSLLTARYNEVYESKEAYFAGEIAADQLQAVLDGRQLDTNEQGKTDTLTALSDLELVKRVKAAKQAVNRLSNQLLYQQNTVGKVENPLPDCPKRQELEAKLHERKREFAALSEEKKRRGL